MAHLRARSTCLAVLLIPRTKSKPYFVVTNQVVHGSPQIQTATAAILPARCYLGPRSHLKEWLSDRVGWSCLRPASHWQSTARSTSSNVSRFDPCGVCRSGKDQIQVTFRLPVWSRSKSPTCLIRICLMRVWGAVRMLKTRSDLRQTDSHQTGRPTSLTLGMNGNGRRLKQDHPTWSDNHSFRCECGLGATSHRQHLSPLIQTEIWLY